MIDQGIQTNEEIGQRNLREVSIFLIIAFISLFGPAIFSYTESCSFLIMALITMVRNLGLTTLVFFILKARGEPLDSIGWTSRDLKKKILIGFLLFPLFYFSVALVLDLSTWLGLNHLEDMPSSLTPHNFWEILLGFLLVLVVALAEEIIFRGYLLKRFQEITQSTTLGVLLSTLLFALGHGYEGSAGMVTVGYIGLVFSLLYLWQRSLIIPIVLHFFTNFLPMVIFPFLQL